MALIVKFMANYFMNPGELPEIPRRSDPAHDAFLFRQGPTKGLGRIQFHDFRAIYGAAPGANAAVFREQIDAFQRFGLEATPDAEQQKDIDFLLPVGEIFTLVAYGQLILEAARLESLGTDLVEQIFDVLVRDLSRSALELHGKPSSRPEQQRLALEMIRRPVPDAARVERVFAGEVLARRDAYDMRP